MKKRERKLSINTDQKEREFLAINSLGELLPIILIIFFFAYLAGSQQIVDTTAVLPQVSTEELTKTAIAEEKEIVKDKKVEKENIYLNSSPKDKDVEKAPIIKNVEKAHSEQRKAPKIKEEVLPKAQFPKASLREVLPIVPTEQITPSNEKIIVVEEKATDKIVLPVEVIEELVVVENTPFVKAEAVQTLKEKRIASLLVPKIELAGMLVNNEMPQSLSESENELVVENIVSTIEEEKPSKTVRAESYHSSDFKWLVNNYNRGIKKSANFIDTPDGKASYCNTEAGIVLKINDLSNVNSDFGIFVEKSDDGEEYNSIGVINTENAADLFYFDSEQSLNGEHHYRFRSTTRTGEDLEFGKVSVSRRASITPIISEVNAAGKYNLTLESERTQSVKYEIKEAWGSLNGDAGVKELSEGENDLSFDLAGDPGLYFLTITTANQVVELLIEKPGISPDLSFYEQGVSGKQKFDEQNSTPFLINDAKPLSFDFYLKNGNTIIFNEGEYKSEIVKIKKAKIGELPKTLQARHSEEMLWFTVSSNISYLHQKVPVILEHKNQEIAAQINIFSSKNAIRPISHFSPDGDGIQDTWKIPGIESCPNTHLMVFNDWGNLIYKTDNVTEENIWKGQNAGKKLPEGMYYYVLGEYGGWVQLER